MAQDRKEKMSERNAAYQRDGAICVPGVLDEQTQELVARAFEFRSTHLTDNLLDMKPSKGGIFLTDLTSPSFWETPEFLDLLEKTPIPDIALECCGGENLWFYYEQIFWKEGDSRRTPWHQDSSYLPFTGHNLVRTWVTLDPVPPEGRLEFVRRSHRGPLHNASQWREDDPTAGIYPEGSLRELPDIESNRDNYDIISFDCTPSDIVLFHPATFHGGGSTSGHARRRTLSLLFFGDDAQFSELPIPDHGEIVASFERDRVAHLNPGDPFRLKEPIKAR